MSFENTTEQSAVTVIGLGQLGTRVAQAFLAAGFATTVWNRSAGKADALVTQGASRATTLDAAVTAAPLVVVVLPDYATVHDLLAPVAERLRGRALVNLTSGTSPEALDAAAWAAEHEIAYLDAAAMSGTRLIGRPDALFLFGGPRPAFDTHEAVLRSLGNAVHLGADPALTPLYDTALFGQIWGALAGFYHSLALVGTAGVDPTVFADVATTHLSAFVIPLITEHARQAREGVFLADDGTVDIHRAAMEHLIHTSAAQGIGTEVPALFRSLLSGAAAAGHGDGGVATVVETIAAGAR
ncbi:NAD(P)-dependent oxidoreductase [Nocardia sp. NPDC055321]